MLLPRMTKECFEIFMEHFEKHLGQMAIDKVTLFLDRASNHSWPLDSNTKLHHLPTACPELNPVERFFEEMRRQLDGKVYLTVEEIESELIAVLKQFYSDHERVASLTMFSYLDTSF